MPSVLGGAGVTSAVTASVDAEAAPRRRGRVDPSDENAEIGALLALNEV